MSRTSVAKEGKIIPFSQEDYLWKKTSQNSRKSASNRGCPSLIKLHWNIGHIHASAAEKQSLRGKASGKETLLTSFSLKQLYLRLENSVTGDSLQKILPDVSIMELLLKCPCVLVCVRVWLRVRITSGAVIQTHVNMIFSDQSSLFDCKCGSRLEGGGQTLELKTIKKPLIYCYNQ